MIELRPNRSGRLRAYIAGTRVRVQDIYGFGVLQNKSPAEIAVALPHLSLQQIHSALEYYAQHTSEILQEVREDDELAAALRAKLGPGPLAAKHKPAG